MGALPWPFTVPTTFGSGSTNVVLDVPAPFTRADGAVANHSLHSDAEVALEADHADGLDADLAGHRSTQVTPRESAA